MVASQDSVVRSRPREQWVDNLRVIVIAGVIVMHAAVAYLVGIADWYYQDERTIAGVWPVLLAGSALIGALFALGPLFLVAAVGVAACFTAGYALTRVPGISKAL